MKNKITSIVLIALSISILGCGSRIGNIDNDATLCTMSEEEGIRVEIRNAKTGQLTSENAIVIITGDNYKEILAVDSLIESVTSTVRGALEREGVYDVNITMPGFSDWSKLNVRVKSGEGCHVVTKKLVARMVPR
jgi:hypothetical protein